MCINILRGSLEAYHLNSKSINKILSCNWFENPGTLKSKYLHKWVTVQGWLFFDAEHKPQAENTNPGNAKNWRGTAWEIHPNTSIELMR